MRGRREREDVGLRGRRERERICRVEVKRERGCRVEVKGEGGREDVGLR